jgi:rSAM/selenodomain-associated transferase 2
MADLPVSVVERSPHDTPETARGKHQLPARLGRRRHGERPLVSIIIPTYNEAASIEATIDAVARLTGDFEVLVVDGCSRDGTRELLEALDVPVLHASKGRGSQLRAGARLARGEVLWFLHADTRPPRQALAEIHQALLRREVAGGNFQLRFDGETMPARFMTWFYAHIGRFGLCYGDSGLFVRRAVYDAIGGFRGFPIFEDLDLVSRLTQAGRFRRLRTEIVTSSRRFEGRVFLVTFVWWVVLQLLYWLGVPPVWLGRLYAPIRGRKKTASV